jgi:MerR family mercuric resistance operon transcriptional regulator
MTGSNVETIRYYERIGLLPEPRRSEGGQRRYRDDDIRRLAFIRRSRELGFAIAEVKNLLGYVDDGDYTCEEIRALTLGHLAAVRRKLADLRRLERALKAMVLKCDGGDVSSCPILNALSEGTAIRSR